MIQGVQEEKKIMERSCLLQIVIVMLYLQIQRLQGVYQFVDCAAREHGTLELMEICATSKCPLFCPKMLKSVFGSLIKGT